MANLVSSVCGRSLCWPLYAPASRAICYGIADRSPTKRPNDRCERAFKIKQFSITETGRGKNAVAVGTFTLENRGDRAVKDVQLRCDHVGERGTIIGSSSLTISEVFQAHSVRTIRNLNMGAVRSQIAQSDCEVIGLSLVSPAKGL